MYPNEPYRPRSGRPYAQETHFIAPPDAYYHHERNGYHDGNRQPEAPYHLEAKEGSNQDARYRYEGHRYPPSFPRHGDRGFSRPPEEMHPHYEAHPRAGQAPNFPPRHNYSEDRFQGHARLQPSRPMSYSQDRGEMPVPSHISGRDSPPTEGRHTKGKIISPQTSHRSAGLSANPHLDRTIKLTQSTDSASTMAASADSVSFESSSKGKKSVSRADQPSPAAKEESTDMLSDALLLASVAKMARSEADHKPTTTTAVSNKSSDVIERTVSVDAKDPPLDQGRHTRTPSPRNVEHDNEYNAITPSLSSKIHAVPHVPNSELTKEIDSQDEDVIKKKFSQVSIETSGDDRAPPRHPLSYPREEIAANPAGHYRGRSPSFTSTGPVPRQDHPYPKRGPDADSLDNDRHRRYHQQYPPPDGYHHSYGGHQQPPPRPHDLKHDRYPPYRPHPRYEETSYYEDETRHGRYPPLQPMHHHRPRYPKDDRPYYPPPAGHYSRPPGYHGMHPQHYMDRRGPPRGHEDYHPPAHREGYRPPAPPHEHHYRGYPPPPHNQGQPHPHQTTNGKIILKRKCAWKNYPELEHFLIENRDEYLRHSAMNYTQEQKQYNNELTERLLEVANKHNYEFDRNDFNFVAIRDRIRCYYKSYVQNCKKRGISINHKTVKRQKIEETEEDCDCSTKDTITTVSISYETAEASDASTTAADCVESVEARSKENRDSNVDDTGVVNKAEAEAETIDSK